MYKIVGGDGKEYGPITADQLRQWIVQGRANGATMVQAQGSGDWKPLRAFPEFSAALPKPAGLPPAPIHPGDSTGAATTSGLAIASLVLGILGVFTCGISALVGLVLGIVALVQINRGGGRKGGSGLAIAGICVAAVSLLILPALLFPAFAKAKQKALMISCVNNMKQVDRAFRMYAADHNNQLPTASTWSDSISNYVGSQKVFHCPVDPHSGCSFAFNRRLSGMYLGKINPKTVLLFESDAGWNASGGPELNSSNRHGRNTCNVVFADGSLKYVQMDELYTTLRWNP